MSTTKTQRIGIWVIAVFMAVGTIGSFVVVGMANDNAQRDKERFDQLYAQYESDQKAYDKQLSDKYFKQLDQFKSRVRSFDKDAVTKLVTTDLKKGEGDKITADSSFNAYYIGWNPSGKIFDSSFNEDNNGLSNPLPVSPGGVIEGWTKGIADMKEGGIRELTIPADLAYGDQARGEDIPANSPLMFIVLIVPAEDINNAPTPSKELTDLYARVYGN